MRSPAAITRRRRPDGTRIIPCCGFDSVPSDLGALLMARYIRDTMGVPCAEVRGYFQFSGGLNGGTVASLLNMLNARGAGDDETTPRPRDGRIRMVKAPAYDAELGTWIGPFVMAPTNTQVVRRSIVLSEEWQQPYGPQFVYQEAMRYDPPFARGRAICGIGRPRASLRRAEAAAHAAARSAAAAEAGHGAVSRENGTGWFTCDLLGIAEDGRQARGLIRYDGDPGNRATTVFLCESALALATRRGSPSRRARTRRRVDAGDRTGRRARRTPPQSRHVTQSPRDADV